jgi:hypothetical protein
MVTSARTRALAWVSAIPHWLYFTPLRSHNTWWRQAILWSSGLGFVTAALGIVLALVQWKTRYVRWMKWHYWTGVGFGVFALTWTFSGLLSIEPGNWASPANGPTGRIAMAGRISEALAGGFLDLSLYPAFDAPAWRGLLGHNVAKEIILRRIQGASYYEVHVTRDGVGGTVAEPLLVAAISPGRNSAGPRSASPTLKARSQPFGVDEIVGAVQKAVAGVPILAANALTAYDGYYYDRGRGRPLPVVRVELDDPEKTWIYVDLAGCGLVARFTRRQRIERWLYHGLHSLDFSFWYSNRFLWSSAVVILCCGGALLSAIGVVIGLKRVKRLMRAAP